MTRSTRVRYSVTVNFSDNLWVDDDEEEGWGGGEGQRVILYNARG
jgi:hypothetical protein